MKGHDFVNMLAGWGLCVSTYANLGKRIYGTAGIMLRRQLLDWGMFSRGLPPSRHSIESDVCSRLLRWCDCERTLQGLSSP